MSDSKRLIDLLGATDEFFKSRGIDAPRRNAEALFAKALGIPRIELYLQFDRPLKDHELEQIRELIRRRSKREPLQYLLGEVEFCGATIQVGNGLLVPRPETEELVAELIKSVPPNARILDIGSGTGCIAVAIAKQIETARVLAVDVDADAVAQVTVNAQSNGVAERIVARQADMHAATFTSIAREPFDVIISNPPYLREDELAALEPEVRDFERKHALVSGPRGDECFARLAELVPTILKPGGMLGLEFGFEQAARVRELFSPEFSELSIHRDMQGIERFLIGLR
ncbi:MAG: peptide chain release factor N(5)-glutamine methyltransferase [bacterium]|nr:peptide chain release factor N(5)-glutamine methyltransferase [bacterium]